VAVSTNYGLSWNLQNNAVKSRVGHIAVAAADPSKVYASSYAGFYKSSDFGANWDPAHEGVYTARIKAIDVDPRMILIANGDFYLMSLGWGRDITWEHVMPNPFCTLGDILINPDNPETVLVLEGYG
jgi:hypothetical protein